MFSIYIAIAVELPCCCMQPPRPTRCFPRTTLRCRQLTNLSRLYQSAYMQDRVHVPLITLHNRETAKPNPNPTQYQRNAARLQAEGLQPAARHRIASISNASTIRRVLQPASSPEQPTSQNLQACLRHEGLQPPIFRSEASARSQTHPPESRPV